MYFPVSLYFGIQAVLHPIIFWFIVGAYDNDITQSIFSLAMLNLINRSYVGEETQSKRPENESIFKPVKPLTHDGLRNRI
jgi:hypothetical protein